MKSLLLVGSYADSLLNFRGPLIAALLEKRVRVHVAAPGLGQHTVQRKALETLGVIVHDLYMARTGMNPITDIRTLWNMFRLIKSIAPDAVLAYTIKPVIYGVIAAKIARVTHIFALITGLGYAFQSKGSRITRSIAQLLYRFSLSRAEKVFFQNPDDKQLFLQRKIISSNVPAVVVNGSGVDLDFFKPAVPPTKPAHFLLIARLLGSKGVREYVQAAEIIKQKHADVCFSLAGWIDSNPDSISETELSNWIQTGTINFLGKLADVRPALQACSVYVLPSYREGTPRTVLEAMSTGRAIITTDAPGCRETVVHGKNGFLVPIQSAESLASAMEVFIKDTSLIVSMGRESRNIVEQKYDVRKVNEFMLAEMKIHSSSGTGIC